MTHIYSLALDAHFLLSDEVLDDHVRHLVPVCVALVVQSCSVQSKRSFREKKMPVGAKERGTLPT